MMYLCGFLQDVSPQPEGLMEESIQVLVGKFNKGMMAPRQGVTASTGNES